MANVRKVASRLKQTRCGNEAFSRLRAERPKLAEKLYPKEALRRLIALCEVKNPDRTPARKRLKELYLKDASTSLEPN